MSGYDDVQAYDADTSTGPALTSYDLLTPDQFRGLPTVAWRVKNLLPCIGVAFIYGASGSGKTFLALDLAAAIAEGRVWFGSKCTKAPVVYMPLEGAMVRKRTLAWETRNGRPLPNGFRMTNGASFELLDKCNLQGLEESVQKSVGLGAVIIVDTLARATAGLDENSARDMGPAIEAAEHLARQVQGLVILVHHAGKNAANGMRGSSALFAAAETVIEVTSRVGKGAHSWRPEKLKDAESVGEHLFMLESVNLGVDGDGDVITSCIVVWDQASEASKREEFQVKGKNQQLVLEAIRREIKNGPKHPVPDGVPDGVRVILRETAVRIGALELVTGAGVEPGRGTERAKVAIDGLVKLGTLVTAGVLGRKAVVWVV